MKLDNKVIIITGGTSGIGLAIAKRFLAEGGRVVIAAPHQDHFEKIKEQVRGALFVPTDVRQETDVQRLIETTLSQFGALDIVVNNAGVSRDKTMDETSLQDYEAIMDTNVRGAFLVTKHALPHLMTSRGTVINIASKLALIPDPDVPIYAASKAALLMLTKSNALAYARAGVRFNAVCPGPIDTPLLQSYFKDRQEMLDYYAAHNPMGRVGSPEDVANVALFLASDEASFVTGAAYTVDGGGSLDN